MANRFDFTGMLNFNEIDLTAPDVVIQEISKDLSASTQNIITASIAPYTKHIFSYREESGFASVAIALGTAGGKTVDVQESLGKIGEETKKFEFFLSTPSNSKYRYRLLFFQYGMANYPVKVVLEQSIADSISGKRKAEYVIDCNSRDELEELVMQVLTSKRVVKVMQELIRINQIQMEIQREWDTLGDTDDNDII